MEPELQLLRRGDEVARLEPRAMAVLAELLARPGEVVPKEQLIDAVWHTEFITENALTRAIADLRKAFGDDAREPSYIETVHRRGYRLIAAVSEERVLSTGGRSVRLPRWAWIVPVLVAILVAAGMVWRIDDGSGPPQSPQRRPRIVVLPFTSIDADDGSAFAAGLTEEVTTSLVETGRMQVISRTSAESLGTAGKTARELGELLDVAYLLEGSVRWVPRTGDRAEVRITMQLVRTADDVHLWSERFDRSWGDLLGIQTEIAQEVAQRLGLVVEVGTDRTPRPLTGNAAAFHAFMKARGLEATSNFESLATAVSLYERALELDPGFALAAAHLAMAHCAIYNFGVDLSGARVEAASAALKKAQALAPQSRVTRLATVQVRFYMEHDLEAARDELDALERDWPADVEILTTRAYVDRRLGDWARSTEGLQRALSIDPTSIEVLWNLSTNLREMGDFEGADRAGRRVVSLAPDAKVGYWVRVANFLFWDDDTSRARAVMAEVPEPRGHEWWATAVRIEMLDRQWERALALLAQRDDPALVLQARVVPRGLVEAMCLKALRRDEEALSRAEEALDWVDAEIAARPEDFRLAIARATTLAQLGRGDEAMEECRRAQRIMPLERDAVLGFSVRYDAAKVAARLGDAERTVEFLDPLVVSSPHAIRIMLQRAPEFDPIRNEPRFQRLLDDGGPIGTRRPDEQEGAP